MQYLAWFELARAARRRPEPWTRAREARLWRLLRTYDEGLPGGPRFRPQLECDVPEEPEVEPTEG